MASSLRARAAAASLALAVLGGATSSAAAPEEIPAMARETGRARMAEGRALRARGEERAALDAFQQAYELVPVPTTAIEVARSLAALGRLVEARDVLAAIRRMPVAPNEPPPFTEARRLAASLDRALDGQISVVKVDIHGSSDGWTASIDEKPIPPTALAAGVRVDPGEHEIAFIRGDQRVARRFEVASGAAGSVVVVELPDLPEEPSAAKPPVSRERSPTKDDGARSLLFVSGVAVAGVGTVLGLTAAGVALGEKPDCPANRCEAEFHDDIDRAERWANVATAGFVAAGAGLALLVVLWLTEPSGPPRREASGRPFALSF